jgi:hypothetical protein
MDTDAKEQDPYAPAQGYELVAKNVSFSFGIRNPCAPAQGYFSLDQR